MARHKKNQPIKIIKKVKKLSSVTWIVVNGKRTWFDIKNQSQITFKEVRRRKKIQRSTITNYLKPKRINKRRTKKVNFKTIKGTNYRQHLNIDFENTDDSEIKEIVTEEAKYRIESVKKKRDRSLFITLEGHFVLSYSKLPANYSTPSTDLSSIKENFKILSDDIDERITKIRNKLQTTSQDVSVETYILKTISINIRDIKK